VPVAPAANTATNGKLLNSDHSMKGVLIGVLSLTAHAAGIPVARVKIPVMRKVQAVPTLSIKASRARARTVPPMPPPSLTIPLAKPILLLKYWDGTIELTMKHRLNPHPSSTPEVPNSPPTLLVVNPEQIKPVPIKAVPSIPLVLAPKRRRTLTDRRPSKTQMVTDSEPTHDRVEADVKPDWTSSAWMTPQLYVNPLNQNVMIAQPRTTSQASRPPSGMTETALSSSDSCVSECWWVAASASGCACKTALSLALGAFCNSVSVADILLFGTVVFVMGESNEER